MFRVALALVVAAATIWWAQFLSWGAPYIYHPDEPAVMARALRIALTGDLNPGWFRYPSLCLYLHAALARIVHGLTDLPLAPGAELLFEGARAEALPFYVAGRGLSVAFAAGSTIVIMLIVRRVAGQWAALLGGAIFVTSSFVLRSAIYVTVDMALTFFVSLAIWLMLRALDRPADSLGLGSFLPIAAMGGLAAGAKYNGALILAVLAGLVLAKLGWTKRAALTLLACAAISIVTFLLTTPYALLDAPGFSSPGDGALAELAHYRTGHPGADTGSSALKAIATLWHAASPLLFVALGTIAGLRVMSGARRGQVLVLLGSVLVIGAPVVLAKVYFERNCLPLMPPLIGLACVGIRAGVSWLAGIMVRGDNRVELEIGPAELRGRLRLDPGGAAGTYAIRLVALYALP
jgi:4-amino-4-deoxy-L-arabinose transferase-like glycosyltransferase